MISDLGFRISDLNVVSLRSTSIGPKAESKLEGNLMSRLMCFVLVGLVGLVLVLGGNLVLLMNKRRAFPKSVAAHRSPPVSAKADGGG